MMFTLIAAASAGCRRLMRVSATIEIGASEEVQSGRAAAMWYEAFVAPTGTIEGCTVRAGSATATRRWPSAGPLSDVRRSRRSAPTAAQLAGYARFAQLLRQPRADFGRGGRSRREHFRREVSELEGAVDLVADRRRRRSRSREPGEKRRGYRRPPATRCGRWPCRCGKEGAPVSYLYPMIVEFRRRQRLTGREGHDCGTPRSAPTVGQLF